MTGGHGDANRGDGVQAVELAGLDHRADALQGRALPEVRAVVIGEWGIRLTPWVAREDEAQRVVVERADEIGQLRVVLSRDWRCVCGRQSVSLQSGWPRHQGRSAPPAPPAYLRRRPAAWTLSLGAALSCRSASRSRRRRS